MQRPTVSMAALALELPYDLDTMLLFPQVTTECEQRMVGDHLTFLHSECKAMVEKELKDDLKNMYRLLKPIQGAQQVLLDEVQSHIKHQGLEAISGLKEETLAIDFVENVLSVHTRYKTLIVDVFGGDQTFIGAMDKAMTQVINNRQPKSPAKSPELVRYSAYQFPIKIFRSVSPIVVS